MTIPHIDNQKTTPSILESYSKLLHEQENSKRCPDPDRAHIPLNMIRYATGALQPRTINSENQAASKDHVDCLTEALANSEDFSLDPITIWWSGQAFYCIDGHHRIQAYNALRNQKDDKTKRPKLPDYRANSIPCLVFQGTLQEAMSKALSENTKDKLSMSKAEKLNKAWHLTCIDQKAFSKSMVANACKVSSRTVASMRTKLKELMDIGHSPDLLSELSWEEAKKEYLNPREINDSWEDAIVERWAKALGKTFGSKFKNQPLLAARALTVYFGRQERKLEDLANELLEPEYDF